MTTVSNSRPSFTTYTDDILRKKVVICGGGLAGLSAAKMLLDSGYDVELLEGRGIPGGKVSSWRDRDGDWIESGLHVFFGAYDEIFKLMRELGIYENILWKEHALIYTLDNGERFAFWMFQACSSVKILPPAWVFSMVRLKRS